jgi:hypothetical protein
MNNSIIVMYKTQLVKVMTVQSVKCKLKQLKIIVCFENEL